MVLPANKSFIVPKINPEDHGAKVVLCGALFLPPIAMMAALSIYNRVRAKTLFQIDGIVTLYGTISAVGTFATFVYAKNLGLGKHTSALTDEQLESIKTTVLAAILLFFVSQSFVMAAYNVLIRKTARSQRFFRNVDALSAVLAVWSVGNMVLAGMSLSAQASPPYWFMVASAALAICLWIGQLLSFLWIVWSTSARLPVKIRWSISIGIFIPCVQSFAEPIGDIITHLTISPADLFAKDWTLASINVVLTLTCEVFFSVMNLLAPSLPVFFDQTSTGSLHYVPGNNWSRTTPLSGRSQTAGGIGTRQSTRVEPDFNSNARQTNDLAELSKMRTIFSTSIHRQEESKRTSFDSDAILVRGSVEIR